MAGDSVVSWDGLRLGEGGLTEGVTDGLSVDVDVSLVHVLYRWLDFDTMLVKRMWG